ncbi:hypothetical protein ECEC1856_5753, partial [Escherichia coli EC1856]
MVSPPSPLPVS